MRDGSELILFGVSGRSPHEEEQRIRFGAGVEPPVTGGSFMHASSTAMAPGGMPITLSEVSVVSSAAEAVVTAIHSGDVATLRQLVGDHPEVVAAPLGGRFKSRTPLHVVTDWPGYFPNGPAIVRVLVAAGADPNFIAEPGDETPLHWAASSDDVHVAAALIDAGADIDAPGGSIGTPLANAVGYGCWDVARLLVARGALVDAPWQAAALGLLDRLEQLLGDNPPPHEVSNAFWQACAGGQRRAAEYLLARGADLTWTPEYAQGTPLDAATTHGTQRNNLIAWLREQVTRASSPPQ